MKYVIFIALFSANVFAIDECDEAGKNGFKFELEKSYYLTKLDKGPDFNADLYTPRLYCLTKDMEDGGGECEQWLSKDEFAQHIVKPNSVICSYESTTAEIQDGVLQRNNKLIIYIEK